MTKQTLKTLGMNSHTFGTFYVSLAGHLIDLVVVKIQGEQKKKKEMKEISKR